MFGIPGEVFWPTAAFGAMILLVFGGIALLRLVPKGKSRVEDQDLQTRLDQLDQLQERMNELEERVDFAERVFARRRESEPLRLRPE